MQWRGHVVTYSSLQLGAVEEAQPPVQIRHKQRLITDLEAIDKPEIWPDQPDQKKRSDWPHWAWFPTPQKSGQ